MHGFILLQLQRFAQKLGGIAAWENLLREARLPIKSYSPAVAALRPSGPWSSGCSRHSAT
jgi:hypothetical protein